MKDEVVPFPSKNSELKLIFQLAVLLFPFNREFCGKNRLCNVVKTVFWPLKYRKKRTAVQIYFVHSAPIAAPQCKFISTAVQFLARHDLVK